MRLKALSKALGLTWAPSPSPPSTARNKVFANGWFAGPAPAAHRATEGAGAETPATALGVHKRLVASSDGPLELPCQGRGAFFFGRFFRRWAGGWPACRVGFPGLILGLVPGFHLAKWHKVELQVPRGEPSLSRECATQENPPRRQAAVLVTAGNLPHHPGRGGAVRKSRFEAPSTSL